ncbi:MAG: leucine-rich repeat protein, partial [Clostridia bacterium]|nr:leucine-rich repeat protein [Clostridia bacterium]
DAAFLNASQLTSVEIPTTISTIGSRAFEGTGLTAVTLPQSVAEVGADALAANTLTEVTIENDQAVVTGIETAGIPTASVVNVPSAVLNDYETTLASYNGLRATAAAQIVLDAIVSDNMSYGAYMATDSDGNKWYFDLGSFIDMGYYFGDEVFLIWQNDNIDGTQARINYCRIGSNEYDQTILIPSSVRFNESVQTIDIVSMIGRGTSCIFSAFNRVSSVIIPSTILRIEDCAFFGCSNLSLVTIPDSVAFIGTDAFYGCTNLAFVSLPDSIIGVFFRAFKNCNSLKTMTIPASVIDGGIASSAFCGCTGLTKFISKNVNYTVSSDERCLIGSIDGINRNCLIAFAPCGVSTYEIPNTITFIGDNVFYGCVDLLNITIPNSVINLGSLCFGGCIGLTVVTFEDSGESRSSLYICSGAFQGCTSLTTVNWGDNWDGITVTVDNNAFVNCHPDLVVNIPNQD